MSSTGEFPDAPTFLSKIRTEKDSKLIARSIDKNKTLEIAIKELGDMTNAFTTDFYNKIKTDLFATDATLTPDNSFKLLPEKVEVKHIVSDNFDGKKYETKAIHQYNFNATLLDVTKHHCKLTEEFIKKQGFPYKLDSARIKKTDIYFDYDGDVQDPGYTTFQCFFTKE